MLASSDEGWSVPVKGLQVRVGAPSGTHKIKDRVELTLRFRNAAKEPVRIYLIISEPFRAFQSSLWAWDRKGGLVSSQPELHPHGYVVTEKDFHLIEPGRELAFQQTLSLAGSAPGGDLVVEWRYSNTVERWEGGVMTLDGPTKPLFGGGRIPCIWTGQIAARARLQVAP